MRATFMGQLSHDLRGGGESASGFSRCEWRAAHGAAQPARRAGRGRSSRGRRGRSRGGPSPPARTGCTARPTGSGTWGRLVAAASGLLTIHTTQHSRGCRAAPARGAQEAYAYRCVSTRTAASAGRARVALREGGEALVVRGQLGIAVPVGPAVLAHRLGLVAAEPLDGDRQREDEARETPAGPS